MASREQKLIVDSLTQAMASLADNNLTYRIEAEFPEAYRGLKRNFEGAMRILNSTIHEIAGQAGAIHTVSSDVSKNAVQLSQRAEQQAASLEQTAAALDQITASARRSADGADHARKVVNDADADASQSAASSTRRSAR